MSRLSGVCKYEDHIGCTGCVCECHDVPATAVHPDGLRGIRSATTTEGDDEQ